MIQIWERGASQGCVEIPHAPRTLELRVCDDNSKGCPQFEPLSGEDLEDVSLIVKIDGKEAIAVKTDGRLVIAKASRNADLEFLVNLASALAGLPSHTQAIQLLNRAKLLKKKRNDLKTMIGTTVMSAELVESLSKLLDLTTFASNRRVSAWDLLPKGSVGYATLVNYTDDENDEGSRGELTVKVSVKTEVIGLKSYYRSNDYLVPRKSIYVFATLLYKFNVLDVDGSVVKVKLLNSQWVGTRPMVYLTKRTSRLFRRMGLTQRDVQERLLDHENFANMGRACLGTAGHSLSPEGPVHVVDLLRNTLKVTKMMLSTPTDHTYGHHGSAVLFDVCERLYQGGIDFCKKVPDLYKDPEYRDRVSEMLREDEAEATVQVGRRETGRESPVGERLTLELTDLVDYLDNLLSNTPL